MKSLNRVMLIGHLAADPEMRQTKNGHAVATFSVATNRGFRTDDAEKLTSVDFHRIVAWDNLAEICNKYLVKGMAVYLDGRIVNSSYDSKDGQRQYKTEIVADGLNILTWKKAKNGTNEVVIEDVEEEVAAVA